MNDWYCYFEIITLNIKQVMAVFFNKELEDGSDCYVG